MPTFELFFFGHLDAARAERARACGVELPNMPESGEPGGWLAFHARQVARITADDEGQALHRVQAALGDDAADAFSDWEVLLPPPNRGGGSSR